MVGKDTKAKEKLSPLNFVKHNFLSHLIVFVQLVNVFVVFQFKNEVRHDAIWVRKGNEAYFPISEWHLLKEIKLFAQKVQKIFMVQKVKYESTKYSKFSVRWTKFSRICLIKVILQSDPRIFIRIIANDWIML